MRVSSVAMFSLLFAACGHGGELGMSESGQRTEREAGHRPGEPGSGGDACHGGGGRGHHGGGHGHHGGPGDRGPGTPDAGGATDAGATADAGSVPEPCAIDLHCTGGARCLDGFCKPACTGDEQCAMGERCELASGACRPLTCAERATEAECLAEAGCQPVYAGIDCVDEAGGGCTAGDQDCRCARFTFALCVDGDAR